MPSSSYNPETGLRRNYDPIPIQVKEGQSKKTRVGFVPGPLKLEEMQRLLLLYYFGDEAASSSLKHRPAIIEDPANPGEFVMSANPNDDLIIHKLRAKMTDICFATEILGGTIIYDGNCPDVQLISITDARALEAAQDPETFESYCLPAIPEDETEEETTERLEKEGLQQWVIIHIDPADIDKLIADYLARHHGSGQGGSDYGGDGGNVPGSGVGSNIGPGTGFPDTGQGGSEFDTSGGNWLKVCFDPPILLDGPHLEDIALTITPGSGIIPVQHVANFTQKIQDAFHKAFGAWGKLFRFKACEIAFDGLDITQIEYHVPVDFTLPVIGPLNPKITWQEAGGANLNTDISPSETGLAAIIEGKLDGASVTLADLTCETWNFAAVTIGQVASNPNDGHFLRCNTIGGGYSLVVVPPYAKFEDGVLTRDYNGNRWFLNCLTCHNPTEYEATMPFTSVAGVEDHSALTTQTASGTYPSNGWNDDGLLDYGGGVKAWYCSPNGSSHLQVFLPEGKSCSKIIFDVVISNPDGVTDADWDCRVWTSQFYGFDTGPYGSGTQHNHTSGSHSDTSSHHLEVDLGGTHDFCTPFAVQVYGGVILYSASISFA